MGRAFLRRTLAFARETGEMLVEALHHLGNVELALGNLVEARRLNLEMLRLSEGWDFSFGLAVALIGAARVALAKGELAEARAQFSELSRYVGVHSRSITRSEALAAMAEVEQAEGRAGSCGRDYAPPC